MPFAQGKLKSDTVEAIQTRLAELGYYQGNIHGDLDEATVKAVETFQRHWGLAEDGVANPATWQHLFDRDDRQDGYAFEDILERELREIYLSRKRRLQHPGKIVPGGKGVEAAHEAQLVGLAFSGGGIRSATFNLGVLQAFAELKLLRLFDYLSTVSGGGYTGSWLSALIRRERSLARVEEEISPARSESNAAQSQDEIPGRSKPEPPAIAFLRRYSNYITPKAGLFSGDTWCVVSTYLRNLMLNLIILSAGLGGLLMIPRLVVRGLLFFKELPSTVPLLIAAGLLLLSLFVIAVNLVPSSREETARARFFACPKWIHGCITLPVVLASLFISYLLAFRLPLEKISWGVWVFGGAAVYLMLWVLCWLGGQLYLRLVMGNEEGTAADRGPSWHEAAGSRTTGPDQTLKTVVLLSAPLAGGAGGLLIWGTACLLQQLFGDDIRLWSAVTLGPPLVILVFSAAVALHIGLMGKDFPEAKREWWSRLGGSLLIVAVVWLGWFGIAVYAPLLLHSRYVTEWLKVTLTSGWVVSTVVGVLLGKSPTTGKPGSRSWVDLAARISPAVFVIGLLVVLSWSTDWLLNHYAGLEHPSYVCDNTTTDNATHARTSSDNATPVSQGSNGHAPVVAHDHATSDNATALSPFFRSVACPVYMMNLGLNGWTLLALFLGFSFLTVLLSLRVDINEFSLHHLYRNRLIRCYLGASNRSRTPQPFTGFCERDDLELKTLAPSQPHEDGTSYQGPYHIINAALNLVAGKELAWQKRKAASFVFTPRFCGYEFPMPEAVPDPCGKTPQQLANGCYRPTIKYAGSDGGVSLGTALAISGAAASPNMGYHSSPALAFLLTVFNVRLGWWIGNPAQSRWMKPGPRFGLKYLAQELFGLAGSKSDFVYLSDGGHFENLGLYELVRRRCRLIVACDATQDNAYAFDDLAGAIRKCYADFGIEIEMDVDPLRPKDGAGYSLRRCAVGTIHYQRIDRQATPGTLIYLKAALTGDEPMEVNSYHSRNPDFPHQSTVDQWFDEVQFESYRKLGYHSGLAVLGEVMAKLRGTGGSESEIDPESLLAELRQYWYPPRTEARAAFTGHGRALEDIFEKIRQDDKLRFLDAQIYPEWENLTQRLPASARKEPQWWLPESEEELRGGFYLCNSVIQLMENVYLDLNLEQNHNHPDYRGWMNLFRHWSWSGMFRITWAVSACNFGARFQSFCERRLGMELGRVHTALRLSVKEAGKPFLNGLEKQLLDALLKQNATLRQEDLRVIPLQLVLTHPFKEDLSKVEFTFGYTVLDQTGNILYFRVRDHLRTMGFARLALKGLTQSGTVRGVDLKELDAEALEHPSAEDRSRFESLFRSVCSEHLSQAVCSENRQPRP